MRHSQILFAVNINHVHKLWSACNLQTPAANIWYSASCILIFCVIQVKLWCNCPFWPDDGMCHLRDCSVCECPENEFPEPFKKPFSRGDLSNNLLCQEEKPEAAVDRSIDTRAFKGWIVEDNPWTYDDETDNGTSYIVLVSWLDMMKK